jgi:hypothetical protein
LCLLLSFLAAVVVVVPLWLLVVPVVPARSPSVTPLHANCCLVPWSVLLQYCDFRSHQKATVKVHERIHTGEKPFACQHCEFRSQQASTVKAHEKCHNDPSKPFPCRYCTYRALHKRALSKHEALHTGEKTYGCSSCDFRSSSKEEMAMHQAAHIGVCLCLRLCLCAHACMRMC